MKTYYAIKDVYGNVWPETIRFFRRETVKSFEDICGNWKSWRNRGYRVVKVSVKEETK